MDRKNVSRIARKYNVYSGKLLGVLEDIQKEERYLSEETLKNVADVLDVPLTRVYSVATFYSFFNLVPVGKHIITVCMGTACHVKGAYRILEVLQDLLGVRPGETTKDGKFMPTTHDKKFTVSTARCFGACSMTPVVMIDGKIYGYVNAKNIPLILKEYGWGEKNEN
ncbi:MAG: NAD(P)H-dependent oxidoreductase subunit E [Proteobacteria bacterium]|nr:NAD(P)H-dependent oxidoreductase subunit E [Pseudomonadota bacterium]